MTAARYTFDREIGRGASGPVWSGHDTVLGRRVALKRVGAHPGRISDDVQQGAREARLAASLNHPHVVGVLDLAVIDGEHWLVMECVEGTDLARTVRERGPLEPAEAAHLLAQVAEALAAAHRAGIVHRDVKPSNVLVTADGTAKLTDFGIALSADDPSVTRTGLVTGSPAYLAPEVATGSAATPASDVWSLGATLFHLLAGRPPYHVGDNVLSTMYRIVHEAPPRLPELGALNVVLEHTMATDPRDRWSMEEVHEALVLAGGRATSPTRSTLAAARGQRTEGTPQATRVSMALSPGARPRPRSRRRWTVAAWALGAAAVVLATVLAFEAGRVDDVRDEPAAAGPDGGADGAAGPTASPTADDPAQEMTAFVDDYLATVTSDPRAAWERLTPGFQSESGGFGSYQGFWRTVRSATPSNVTADVGAMTVTYDVDYLMRNGRSTSDRVTLQLVRDGSGYRIDGES